MPTYDYRCSECGHEFEELHSMSDAPLTECPKCHKPSIKRLMAGGAGMVFKGTGFYKTDYVKAAAPKSDGGKEKESSAKAGTSKADSSAEKASSAKSGSNKSDGAPEKSSSEKSEKTSSQSSRGDTPKT